VEEKSYTNNQLVVLKAYIGK